MLDFDENVNPIIRTLISVGSTQKDWHSLWQISSQIKASNPGYLDLIEQNLFDLYQMFLDRRARVAITIGISRPSERMRSINILMNNINSDETLTPQLTNKINQLFQSVGIEFRINDNNQQIILQNISLVKKIDIGIKNIKLLSIKGFVDEIFVYINKYEKHDKDSLAKIVTLLDTAINDAETNKHDIMKMRQILITALSKANYPEISITDKDPGVLANAAFNEKIAAEVVLYTKNNNKEINEKWMYYDNIAVILHQKFGDEIFIRSLSI